MFWIVVIAAVVAVGFFVVGLSVTLFVRGRPMRSEIGYNRHMRERGIECTAHAFRKEEASSGASTVAGSKCCNADSASYNLSDGCQACNDKKTGRQ
ncbi:MAG: hypothetical protein FWE10_00285 [Rikenellaceae bacterium]|nr:hypothetical protein [Rikenellaceae bacterium]